MPFTITFVYVPCVSGHIKFITKKLDNTADMVYNINIHTARSLYKEVIMLKSLKSYAFDTIANILAQVFILFAGVLAVAFGGFSFLFFGWVVMVIGYSFLLARMGHLCEKRKGVAFGHYFSGVMLPSNVIALAVSCCCCCAVLSGPRYLIHYNMPLVLLIFIGSAAITLISVFFNRVALR